MFKRTCNPLYTSRMRYGLANLTSIFITSVHLNMIYGRESATVIAPCLTQVLGLYNLRFNCSTRTLHGILPSSGRTLMVMKRFFEVHKEVSYVYHKFSKTLYAEKQAYLLMKTLRL